jgi:hypothetical protein
VRKKYVCIMFLFRFSCCEIIEHHYVFDRARQELVKTNNALNIPLKESACLDTEQLSIKKSWIKSYKVESYTDVTSDPITQESIEFFKSNIPLIRSVVIFTDNNDARVAAQCIQKIYIEHGLNHTKCMIITLGDTLLGDEQAKKGIEISFFLAE